MGRKFGWVVAMLVLAWCVADVIARASRARALSEPWAGGLGSLDEVPLRHTPHPRSAAANHRADLARTVGIDLTTGDNPPGAKAREVRGRFIKVQKSIDSYVRRQLRRADDFVEVPPSDVATFLDANAAALQTIRADLLANPGDWAVDKPWENADLSLIGHLDLTRLLVASALARALRSDVAGAWEDLHCIWELGRPLRHRRDLSSQSFAVAMARMIEATASKLLPPAPDWHREVDAYDPRPDVIAAFQVDSKGMAVYALDELPHGDVARRIVITLLDPLLQFGVANREEVARRMAAEVVSFPPCLIDDVALDRRAALAGWNPLARATPVELVRYAYATLFLIEREGTARILELKRRLLLKRVWPAEAKDLHLSICPRESWIYRRNPDGTMDLAFSGLARWKTTMKTYPLRFHYDAP